MRLVTPSGVVAASYKSPSFTPSSMANILDWVDCSDTAKITASSNNVSAVAGQLGVVTWSQATGAQKPKSGVNTINSKNVLDFGSVIGAGNDTWLDSGTISLSTTGCCEWFVGQITTVGDGSDGLTVVMDGDATNRAALFVDSAGHVPSNWSLFSGDPGATYPNQTSLAGDTSLHLVIANWVSGGTSVVYVDGTAYNLPTAVHASTFTASRIGQDATHTAGTTNNRFSGHMCAWGLASSIAGSSDRGNLRTWAQAIWGTP